MMRRRYELGEHKRSIISPSLPNKPRTAAKVLRGMVMN
ncbi:hypothetical protein GGD54_006410 [Rhizobium tropici]|uniref:Uncharacterized protein n=1 Tax=Rhizobium tropici TaxID=398 RepID=A0ABR6R9U2_RHITR|nr:hypothetical protein [Rhizobium tropici]MBB5596886.1 hypothetical protein [Rhizobium tropici]MBB6495943.1 hypothetical protein [Rhizobium tropici]